MNIHKHARLTFSRRLEMVQQLVTQQCRTGEAAHTYGVTPATVRKWLGRFLAQGQRGLADASSRPFLSSRAIAPAKALAIAELRRKRLTQARIAQALGVSISTVSHVLARAGISPITAQPSVAGTSLQHVANWASSIPSPDPIGPRPTAKRSVLSNPPNGPMPRPTRIPSIELMP